MIYYQRVRLFSFYSHTPALCTKAISRSRRLVPVPGGHFLFLKDHLTTPGNHLIAGTLTLSPCCLLLPSTKSRILCAFTLLDPHFRAFRAQNRHFCAREEWEMASGSVKVTFLQFTAHANVPQRCLEQGFVCAVICRNCATDN